jgi:hypothetical protein
VGDDRAETYLRRLAETEFRRMTRRPARAVGRPDGRPDAPGMLIPDGAFMLGLDIASSTARIEWVGDVLVAAGVLSHDVVARIAIAPDNAFLRSSGQAAFWLRLTPPLNRRPDTIEVAVTGPATRVGALVPVREAPGMPDT